MGEVFLGGKGGRGDAPGWLPAYPAFNLLSCPLSPRPPSPVGKGETITLFRRGLRPRHPGIKPPAALTEPAAVVPGGAGFAPPASSAARVHTRGCKGRSPLHEITLVSPFPPGRGSGGWGQDSIDTAGKAGAAGYSTRPAGGRYGRANKCRRRSNAGDARGEAPCIRLLTKPISSARRALYFCKNREEA